MAYITIGYKGETIAGISASGTTTLETAGKYCEDDITITFSGGSVTQDSSIYSFRQSTHNANLMRLKKIIGGSVAWNQLANNGSASVTSGHKYISCSSGTWSIGTSNGTAISAGMVFDITLMFGSTIADYIYGLGSASCVTWFRHLFPSASYPSDAGSLLSVKTSAHKMVGFNQWDEEWELGGLVGATGATYSANDRIRSKNFCRCVPSTVYYCKAPNLYTSIWWYDASKGFIKFESAQDATNQKTVTSPSDAAYFKLVIAGNTTTYGNNLCLNISRDGERNGEYEPYVECEYALSGTIELRGILKLDANNNLYYDGDEYASDGTVTRKYGIVDLSTLNWGDSTSTRYVSKPVSGMKPVPSGSALPNIIAQKYRVVKWSDGLATNHDAIAVSNDNNGKLYLYKDSNTSTPSGYMVFELATPTTESSTPYIELQATFPNGTEEFVDARTVPMPVSQDAEYFINENS